MNQPKIGGAIDNPHGTLKTVKVERLRYKWEDEPNSRERSRVHETYLGESLYHLGLTSAGNGALVRLFRDIEEKGILKPLIVYPTDEPGVFQVKLGNQRLAIARALGIEEVECWVVRPKVEVSGG